MYREIEFKVNRDDLGVSGFTLMGVGKTEAECFCLSFLTAQQKRKASVTFEDGNIVFTHGGVSIGEANENYFIYGMHQGGKFSCDISDADAKSLDDLLNRRGAYAEAELRAKEELAWGKGFTLYIKRD